MKQQYQLLQRVTNEAEPDKTTEKIHRFEEPLFLYVNLNTYVNCQTTILKANRHSPNHLLLECFICSKGISL